MPEWLLKDDEYVPSGDRDAFINKSILSLLNILTKFKTHTKYIARRFGVNASIKLITSIIFIIFVALAKNFSFVLVASVCLLVIINLLDIEQIKHVLKMSLAAGIFTCIILLPSIFLGYGANFLMIILKVLCTVTMVNILASTTEWNDLIAAFKLFHIPDIFIFVLDITMKYIVVLGEFSLNMFYALKIRSVGKSKNKNTSIAGIMGTLFLKSKEMAEEMQGAMECRGFNGEYRMYKKVRLKYIDYFCILFNVIFIFTYFYIDRL
jgi:cobalt/nickel transport system permease protein